MSTERNLTVVENDAPPRRAEALQVFDPIPILDTARFEQMQRIALTMARCVLVPNCLRFEKQGEKLVPLPIEAAVANCFLVVNQAVRWNMDPFAVAQCCSTVKGRLMFEGKLIAAVLAARLEIRLDREYFSVGTDQGIRIIGPPLPGRPAPRIVEGTVSKWRPRHTEAGKSPWDADPARQLWYRGQRQWVREWEPALLFGVYSPDELEDLESELRHVAARAAPLAIEGPRPQASGASGASGASEPAPQQPRRRTKAQAAADFQGTQGEKADPSVPQPAPVSDTAASKPAPDPEKPAPGEVDWSKVFERVRDGMSAARTLGELDEALADWESMDGKPRAWEEAAAFQYEQHSKRLALAEEAAAAAAKAASEAAAAASEQPVIDPEHEAYKWGVRDGRDHLANKLFRRKVREDIPGYRDHYNAGYAVGERQTPPPPTRS